MFEQTITVDTNNIFFLDYIDDAISMAIKSIGGVTARATICNRAYLAIACNEVFDKQIKDTVKAIVLDILAIGYKSKFIHEHIDQINSGFVSNTLINSMSVFDCCADKSEIDATINLSGDIHLDGYYNFRMKDLKAKWLEVIELANDNGLILSDKEVMSEFLSYMLEGVSSRVNNLSVVMDSDSYYLFDTKNNILANTQLPIDNMNTEESVIMEIIINKPKSVTLYCDKYTCSDSFVNVCQYLFDTNIIKNS